MRYTNRHFTYLLTYLLTYCVQLYELGAGCGENEGDGDVVPVCSSMSWEFSVVRTKATVMLCLCAAL